jgi:hypothetical protein
MQRLNRSLPWSLLVLALALVAASGCGARSALQPADPDQAREALRTALDGWQQGQAPDALSNGRPPIRVADEDWLAGVRLADYQVLDQGQPVGNALRCPVRLTLRDVQGRPLVKAVVYRIDTHPAIFIARED